MVVIVEGDTEQGVAAGVGAALVLRDRIDDGIACKTLALEGMAVDGLQQVHCAVRLRLHESARLRDEAVSPSLARDKK